MKIAMMTNNYKPFVGGVPISVERLSRGLRRLGHTVHIFAPAYAGEDQTSEASDEEYVIRYGAGLKKAGTKFLIPNSFDRSIFKKFATLGIEIIHTHHPVLAGNTAWYLSRKHGTPLVFTWHTQYDQYLHYADCWKRLERKAARREGASAKAASWMVRGISRHVIINYVKRFANRCDTVLAPSESMRRRIREYGVRTPVHVLETGIEEHFFQAEPDHVQALRGQLLEGRRFLLCTVARLAQEKNIAFLLESARLLHHRLGSCFRHVIIGNGPDRELMEQRVQEYGLEGCVDFLGNLPNETLKWYYHAADLFLFASTSETQGIVLLEAMAGSTPVVAVDACGVCDVVMSGHNGLLTGHDTEGFVDAVAFLLNAPEVRQRAGRQARQTARQYTVEAISRKMELAYAQVLEQRGKEQSYEAVESVYRVPQAH